MSAYYHTHKQCIFFLAALIFMVFETVGYPIDSQGTTYGIEEIFKGRCWDYQLIIHPGGIRDGDTMQNCTELWDVFHGSFSFKVPCDLTADDYEDYFELSKPEVPKDMALFWSGTLELSHEYSSGGHRKFTLEDTLPGYVANNIQWCGKVEHPGIDYESCPAWGVCPEEANDAYWGTASTSFAKSASGDVTVLLNGSRTDGQPAYRNNSYFAKYELPNLDPGVVTLVRAVVAHDPEQPIRETCENGSLLVLEALVKDRGLEYQCLDDPHEVRHLLCVDSVASPECQFADQLTKSKYRNSRNRPKTSQRHPDLFFLYQHVKKTT